MASFHVQWMSAYDELRQTMPLLDPPTFHRLRSRLSVARELINEDNEYDDRRRGGEMVREVRQDCRAVRDASALLDTSAGVKGEAA